MLKKEAPQSGPTPAYLAQMMEAGPRLGWTRVYLSKEADSHLLCPVTPAAVSGSLVPPCGYK